MPYYTSSVSSLELRQARSMRRNQNTVRLTKDRSNLGPVSNTLLLAIIIAVIGLLYLTQLTKTGSFGYQVQELESQKSALIQDNQTLQVESARLQALDRIKKSEVAKSLNDAQNIEFVR